MAELRADSSPHVLPTSPKACVQDEGQPSLTLRMGWGMASGLNKQRNPAFVQQAGRQASRGSERLGASREADSRHQTPARHGCYPSTWVGGGGGGGVPPISLALAGA